MKFHTLENAPLHPNAAVFRQSRLMAFIFLPFTLAMTAGPVFAAVHFHTWIAGAAGLVCALVALALSAIFRHAPYPQNWVLRVHPGGLLIKFRSYLSQLTTCPMPLATCHFFRICLLHPPRA